MLKKNGKAYRRLVISFACVFLVPLGMSLLFYLYAYRTIRERADASNVSLLNTVKSTCDREMFFYENSLVQLALNQTVQKLATVKGDFESRNSYDLYMLNQELESMLVSINLNGNYCRDVFVYFQNNGKVVSSYGSMSFDMYCELYCGNQAEMKTELKNELEDYHFLSVARLNSAWTGNAPVLLMTMSNMQGQFGSTSAMVGMWLDMDALNQNVESVAWERGLEWLMLRADGTAFNRMEESLGLGIAYDEIPEDSEKKIKWQDEVYLMRAMSSGVGDWKYVILMSEAQVRGQAAQLRNVFIAVVFLCMCVGSVAASRMVRVNYYPLQKVMNLFPVREEEELYNEYQYLEKKLKSFFRERSDFRKKVAEDWELLRQYYLADLLENPYEEYKDTPDSAAFSETIRSGGNLVLLLRVRETENAADEGAQTALFSDGSGKQQREASVNSLKHFIVCNVFAEGLGEQFRVEKVEQGETIAMILNLGAFSGDYGEILADTVDSLQKFIHEHFGFTVAVFAGEAHEGLAGVHESWLEAKEAEGFIDMLEEDFIRYGEIRNISGSKYDYSQEQEDKIINALVSGNASMAVSYINKVLDVNFRENKLPCSIRTCLLYDLAGTLMKASEKVECTGGKLRGGKTELELQGLSANQPLETVREKFRKMAEAVCREDGSDEESSQNQILCREVLEYIQENYGDPDLNISLTGQHFNMTPAYLSSIFRKETGESLLKVITMTRVREAEKLLKEGASVVEVGEKVGFRDSSTFIRIFKKYMGVTPGQIKGQK